MRSQDIRRSFLDFFADRGHREVASSPLVPRDDPTLLFTNAGMVQFKDVFLGVEAFEPPRAVTSQKCLRVSGKHNDLENVGPSPRHHTFFEMLGNFSFGDYFKEEAIELAWELVTGVWEIPIDRLFASVYHEDDEAFDLWRRISSLPEERIARCGAADNFWAMGETGPCGPCSEIFVDARPDLPAVSFEKGEASGRYLEIWNLVFMQFERGAGGELIPLPKPSIDTGSGLERVAAVLQGVASNYDTDLFQPLLLAAAERAGTTYGSDEAQSVSLRVIADHLRAVAFLLADGVIPANEGRGYVLRRILRRAVRHGMSLGLDEPFLGDLLPALSTVMGDAFPELGATASASAATIASEEEKFLRTLATGAQKVQEALDRARSSQDRSEGGEGRGKLTGEVVFRLYDTYGLPIDVVREIAEEERFELDEEGFARELERQRVRSRTATTNLQDELQGLRKALLRNGELPATDFVGYDQIELEAAEVVRLVRLGDDFEPVDRLSAGERGVVLFDRTAFYAESGGQVADGGALLAPGMRARVEEVQKDPSGAFLHWVEVVEGELRLGQEVTQQVTDDLRRSTERHHTATHLLHAALREHLGDGVRQAGSLVHPQRLRFDFTHSSPLTETERQEIENTINTWVRRAVPVEIEVRPYAAAIEAGAMALFGEKYGDQVRTVNVPGFSLELCGGCHVRNTGEIGPVVITQERAVASGVRRIEALAGSAADDHYRRLERVLATVEGALGVPLDRVEGEIASLQEKLRETERELSSTRMKLLSGAPAGDEDEAIDIDGVKLLLREVPAAPVGELRNLADVLRGRLGTGVVVLGTREGEKVSLIAAVTKDLEGRVHAGQLARTMGDAVGGSGGGRPDFAQAGGKDPAGPGAAFAAVRAAVSEQLGAVS